MRFISLAGPFPLKATTGHNLLPKVVLSNVGQGPAVAETPPMSMLWSATGCLLDHGETAESLPAEIFSPFEPLHRRIIEASGE